MCVCVCVTESVCLFSILYQQVKSQIMMFGGDSASVVLVVTDGTLLDIEETVTVVSCRVDVVLFALTKTGSWPPHTARV